MGKFNTVSIRHPLFASVVILLLGATPTSAGASGSRIEIFDSALNDSVLSAADLKSGFFNKATCDCNKTVGIRITFVSDSSSSYEEFRVVIGNRDCIDSEGKLDEDRCETLRSNLVLDAVGVAEVREFPKGGQNVDLTAKKMMGGECSGSKDRVVLLVGKKVLEKGSTDNGQEETRKETTWKELLKVSFSFDADPPEAPSGETNIVPGDNMVEVDFGNRGTGQDKVSYQILCHKVDPVGPAFEKAPFTPIFKTCQSGARQEDLDLLNENYVCSGTLSSSREVIVSGLENDVEYSFVAVAVDPHGNPSTPVKLGTGRPMQGSDFWEHYKEKGGRASGGFCSATGRPDGSVIGALPLAFVLFVLQRQRRRARTRTGAGRK